MPTSNSSSSRPGSSWSVTTRAQIAPTVCQATRTSRRTAVLSILVASHATRSSKSRVKPDSTLANGTPSVRTPWVGQSIRRSLALTTSRRRPRSRCRLLEWEQSAQASRRRRSATVTVICAGSNETSRTVVPGRASKRLNAVVTRTGVGPPGWGLDTCNPTVWPVRVTHPGPSTSSAWSYQHLRVPRTPGAPTFSSGAPDFRSSVALVDTLAGSLWAYWKLALRVVYYGRQGQRGSKDLNLALRRWDGDDAWQIGCEIQIQVSRSKRLLSPPAQQKLDKAQQDVVDYLDHEIDRLRDAGTPDDWKKLYASLMTEKRMAIDSLLTSVTADLKIGGTPRQLGTGLVRPTRARDHP